MAFAVFETLALHRVVPIVVAGLNASNADGVGDALVAGGLPLVEVTLRTPDALAGAAKLARRGDLLVSTGTILTLDQAKASVDAGVTYLVAPGLDLAIVEWCQARGVILIPGATTATEITHAYTAGLRVLKFFPSEAVGGVATLNALSGPFADVRFMPTGGIQIEMFKSYLSCAPVIAVGQGSILKREWIEGGHFDRIEAETRRAKSAAGAVKVGAT